jgi:hypothetical protein
MTSTFTRIAGGGPCGPFGCELQADSAAAAAIVSASLSTDPDLPKLEVLLGNIELIARSTPSLLNRRITLGGVIGSANFSLPVKSFAEPACGSTGNITEAALNGNP